MIDTKTLSTLLLALAQTALAQVGPVTPAPAPSSNGHIAAVALLHVDAGGGGDFTELGDAIAAAPEGAVILVAPGFYSADVRIDGKSLRISATEAAGVSVTRPLTVENLGVRSRDNYCE